MEEINKINEEEEDLDCVDIMDACADLIPEELQSNIYNIFDTQCLINIDKAPLHPITCSGTFEELLVMSAHIKCDPESLERVHYYKSGKDFSYAEEARPLHKAAEMGHTSCVRFLLDAGADVNALTEFNRRALEFALYGNASDDQTASVFEVLINRGSPVVSPLEHEWPDWTLNALDHYEPKPKSALVLLKYGSWRKDSYRYLSYALKLQNFKLYYIKMLILHGITIDKRDGNRHGPPYIFPFFHEFVLKFDCDEVLQCIDLYYQCGGRMHIKEDGKTVVDWLLSDPSYEEYKYMLEERVDYIKIKMSTPLSLSSLARISIRDSMGGGYLKNIDTLPLPTDIKSFLKFDEIDVDPPK